MKKVVARIISLIYFFFNLQSIKIIQNYLNIFYSLWIRNCFSDVGECFYSERPISIIGGKNIQIGSNTSINRFCTITAWTKRGEQQFKPQIVIGNNCCFGEYNHITCINSVKIGDGVLTGRWVTITDNSHGDFSKSSLRMAPIMRDVLSKGGVTIGDNVWIGEKATILPNVFIGEGAIIAANAVVTKDVPPYSIVAGTPAVIVKHLI